MPNPMTNLLGRASLTLAGVSCLASTPERVPPSPDPPRRYEDLTITVALPSGWRIDGAEGEYLLESDDQNVASLLLLTPEADRSLEERLAAIEEQFTTTGMIELEESEARVEADVEVFYRRYRLTLAGAQEEDSAAILLHQYSFWRANVQVLLQVETVPELPASEDLFSQIFRTLEIHRAPNPFVFQDTIGRG